MGLFSSQGNRFNHGEDVRRIPSTGMYRAIFQHAQLTVHLTDVHAESIRRRPDSQHGTDELIHLDRNIRVRLGEMVPPVFAS